MNSFSDPWAIAYEISVLAIPVIVAITFHEAAHGYVAWRLGDDTAWRLGRVSFNPFRHIDLFGTILLPAMLKFAGGPLFGYAKPVPVNFGRLGSPRRDMVYVALAGPGANLALALACGLAFHLVEFMPTTAGTWVAVNLRNAILVNLVLAVFNMIPLPPLDGGRVAVGLLPDALAFPLARLERSGIFILIALLFFLPWALEAVGISGDPLGFVI
jgi:Zn-dependent protease